MGAAKLYALDPVTGCTKWVFKGEAPVRTGVMVATDPAQGAIVYFGDSKARIYAVGASTGKLLWKAHVDDNFAAMITGTPVVYKGVLYAGVSSFEEVMAASPKYPCCSFRGSVVALSASTGAQLWNTYTIETPPQEIAGSTFRGPSGAGIWSSPTIDEKLQRLYVATGDNYSEPATGTSDAFWRWSWQPARCHGPGSRRRGTSTTPDATPACTDRAPRRMAMTSILGSHRFW